MAEREVELKLAVEPDGIRALRRSSALRALRRTRPRTRRETSVYYDTPEGDLRRAGAALRTRLSGERRVQTLKATAGPGGHERLEATSELDRESPDPDRLPESLELEGWEALRQTVLRQGLVPLFRSEIRRTAWTVGGDDWSVEVCVDRGALLADGRRERVLEVELELERGGPHHLFDLALLLLDDQVPFRILGASKARRGVLLSRGRPPGPRKWRSPQLPADVSSRELLRQAGHAGLEQFLANQHCFECTGDPAAVHQMRVAMRRIRSALTVLRPVLEPSGAAGVQADLRWLMGELGPLRNLDVFLDELFAPVVAAFPGDEGMEGLRTELLVVRNGAEVRAREALASPRVARLILATGRWLEGPVVVDRAPPPRELGAAMLGKRYRKIRRRARDFASLCEEELHRLRIGVKKLRYAGELFEPLHRGRRSKRFLRTLGKAQDALGKLNDVAVARGLLDEAVSGTADLARRRAAGLVEGWHASRHDDLVKRAAKPVARVRELAPFWG